jgi:site-specific recombinase XerD
MKVTLFLKDKKKIWFSIYGLFDERLQMPTGQKISNSDYWNGKRATDKEPFKKQINTILSKYEDILKDIERDAILIGHPLTKNYVKTEFEKRKLDIELLDKHNQIEEAKPLQTQDVFFNEFQKFINDSESGERETEEGTRLGKRSIQLYLTTLDHLKNFSQKKKYYLTFESINKDFYKKFCNYLWDDLNLYDNAVGNYIKALKTFLTWSGKTQEHTKKYFRKYSEEKDIVVLTPEQLNEIVDVEITIESVVAYFKENKLPYIEGRVYMTKELLERTRDILVLGCVTTLRVSDLLKLKPGHNLIKGDNYKIKVFSTAKSGKFVMIDLPDFACKIIDKYSGKFETVLPKISDVKFNENLKTLGEYMGWNKQTVGIIRYKRKKPVEFTFPLSELLSSHIMRRTGITNLLIAGMDQYAVKEISGHSANSKSFSKYIAYSQSYMNSQFKNAWDNIRGMKNPSVIMKVS